VKQSPLQLILASESPRRKTLLESAGFSFRVFSVKVSENLEKNLNVDNQIKAIAERKVLAAFKAYKSLNTEDFLVLSADTMVVLDQKPLGKPSDSTEAQQMLSSLSGKWHEVKTAICLAEGRKNTDGIVKLLVDIETTRVLFKKISEQQILQYIATGEPMDKAGSYGIQGKGGEFVEKIEGHFDNVVGLPVTLFKKILEEGRWALL
jgi:septum formation protein